MKLGRQSYGVKSAAESVRRRPSLGCQTGGCVSWDVLRGEDYRSPNNLSCDFSNFTFSSPNRTFQLFSKAEFLKGEASTQS